MAIDESSPPNDPGFRYLAPTGEARITGAGAFDLLHQAGLQPRLDAGTALSFLAYGEYHAYRSFLKGLDLIPMGCPIQTSADGSLSFTDGCAPQPHTPTDAPRELRRLIDAAVERALSPWRRAAVWLSGGTDSSAVAASAAATWKRLERDPADLGFYHRREAEGPNEEDAARVIAEALGRDLLVHIDPGADPFQNTASYLARLDFPLDGPGCAAMIAFAKRLADDGIEGFLTGDGGDECCGPRERAGGPRGLVKRALPAPLLRSLQQRRSTQALPTWLRARLDEFPAAQHVPRERVGLEGVAADRDRAIRCARQSAMVETQQVLADMLGMQAGFPLLDTTVTDFCVAIPQQLHGGRDQPKHLLKAACADLLPPEFVQRTKAEQPYYEPNHTSALATWGDSLWERWIHDGSLESSGLLSRAETSEVLAAADTGESAHLYRALALLGIEIWVQELDIEVSGAP